LSEIGDRMTMAMRALVPVYEHMDLKVDVADGRYSATLPHGPHTGSHVGTVHAAFQWAVAEVLGGVAALDVFGDLDDIFLVVKRVEIDFVGPARTDLVARASLTDDEKQEIRDRYAADGEVELKIDMRVEDDGGAEVARAHGVYLIRKRRK
jgi:acyl-coenzyme A thioesterase PaaI-like protein